MTTGVDNGTYTLATYGSKTGSGSMVFANGSTTLGNATLAVNAGNIQMTVAGGALNNSVWTGTSGTWDSGTNWNRNGTAGSAFSAGDWVTIDDTATTTTITSAAPVSPTSLTVNNTTKNFTINAAIEGSTPVVKLGSGTLTLGSATNAYTGGTFIGGGRVGITSNANLGDAAGGITFNGGELYITNDFSSARTVTLNAVAGNRVLLQGNADWTNSGAFTGDGGITFRQNPNGGTSATLTSLSNDFKGALGIEFGNSGMTVRLRSLADSATANGNIIFGIGSTANTGGAGQIFEWDSAAGAALTLDNRSIEFGQNGSAWGTIKNSHATNAITINTDLVVTGTGTKTLVLEAVATTPGNVFDGDIGDGIGTVAVNKAGSGTWTLSGNNSYTGATTISAGTLVGIGANAFGSTSGISLTGTNTLSLRGDSSTAFASSNVTTTATGPTINADQATIAGSGAKTMTMGTIGTSSTAATYQVNFTGANNTSLSAGTLSTPISTIAAVHTINNNISGGGSLNLASVFNQATTIASPNLVFAGTGNTTVSGAITQTLADMDLIKNGAGTLTLNASSTYTGSTSINGGTLVIKGATHNTSSITFSGGGILGLDIASSVNAASATVDFTGQTVTVIGTPTLASYTLLTVGTMAGGDTEPTLSPAIPGYELDVVGNELRLISTGAPTGFAAWQSANSTAGGRDEDHDNDGVDNGTEHFLGGNTNTTGFTALPPVVNTAGTLSVTWTKAATYTGVYNTDYVVETSATLPSPWTTETLGVNVIETGNDVKYTFPGGPAYTGKNFARLKVTGP